MYRYLILSVLASVLVAAACSSGEARLNDAGNQAFADGNFQEAVKDYKRAEVESPDLAEPYYNTANAFYRQGTYDSSKDQMEQALKSADETLAESSFLNLGNVHFQEKNYREAVEAYKEALRLNPQAADAKYNLELALGRLQQQKEQEGKSKEKQPPAEDQQQQGQQDGKQKQREGSGQNQVKPEQVPEGGQQGQPQNGGLNEEQARHLLEAVSRDSKTLQQQFRLGNSGRPDNPVQDW